MIKNSANNSIISETESIQENLAEENLHKSSSPSLINIHEAIIQSKARIYDLLIMGEQQKEVIVRIQENISNEQKKLNELTKSAAISVPDSSI